VFKNDVGNQSLLCVSAVSEDPAICAAAGNIVVLYCSITARVVWRVARSFALCACSPVGRVCFTRVQASAP
jgi:hypothetical protein